MIQRLEKLAQKQDTTIAGLQPSLQDVLGTTGPAMFTEAVFESLSFITGTDFTWHNVSGLTSPWLVSDILILPVNAFGLGQQYSSSSSPGSEGALVRHKFQGSWANQEEKWKEADKKRLDEEEDDKKREDEEKKNDEKTREDEKRKEDERQREDEKRKEDDEKRENEKEKEDDRKREDERRKEDDKKREDEKEKEENETKKEGGKKPKEGERTSKSGDEEQKIVGH